MALNHHVTIFEYDGEKTRDTLITDGRVCSECGATTSKRQKAYQKLIINEAFTRNYIKNVWETTKQRYRKTRKSQYYIGNINK
ncbi:MAG: hypothetical protein ACYCXB_10130 [Candidatus Humimicrobiaceae bacterium]